ncbi:response regulator [Chryseobacterium indoltheticum]
MIDFIKSNEVDIILLDISLPDISGIQLCEEIKKNIAKYLCHYVQ